MFYIEGSCCMYGCHSSFSDVGPDWDSLCTQKGGEYETQPESWSGGSFPHEKSTFLSVWTQLTLCRQGFNSLAQFGLQEVIHVRVKIMSASCCSCWNPTTRSGWVNSVLSLGCLCGEVSDEKDRMEMLILKQIMWISLNVTHDVICSCRGSKTRLPKTRYRLFPYLLLFPRSPKLFTETKMKQVLGKHCAVIAVPISQRDEGQH